MADMNDTTPPSGYSGIRYHHLEGLSRPMDLPRTSYLFVVLLMVVALIIGATLSSGVIDEILNGQKKSEAAVAAAIAAHSEIVLPDIKGMLTMDDQTIKNTLTEQGIQYVDMNEITSVGDANGLDLMKVPEGTTIDEAAVVFANGIALQAPPSAAQYLSGTWRLQSAAGEALDKRIRYADFTSASAADAVTKGITAAGLDGTAFGESGVDASGNTFQSGTVDIDGTVYNWQVSCCPLSEVYDVSGFPSTANYVGVRFYQ